MRMRTMVAVGVVLALLVGVVGWAGESPATMSLPEGAVARLGLGWGVICVAYSPTGKLLAVGRSIGVELRDAGSLELVAVLTGHTREVDSVAFSPDGEILGSGSVDGTVKLWDVGTGTGLRTLVGNTRQVYSVSFSPDGKLLASVSGDGTVLLWDVEAVLGAR